MKKEPWKIVVFSLSVVFIICLWVKNGLVSVYAGLSLSDAMPLLATGFAVTAVKVAILAGMILIIKWIMGKIGGGRK